MNLLPVKDKNNCAIEETHIVLVGKKKTFEQESYLLDGRGGSIGLVLGIATRGPSKQN